MLPEIRETLFGKNENRRVSLCASSGRARGELMHVRSSILER